MTDMFVGLDESMLLTFDADVVLDPRVAARPVET